MEAMACYTYHGGHPVGSFTPIRDFYLLRAMRPGGGRGHLPGCICKAHRRVKLRVSDCSGLGQLRVDDEERTLEIHPAFSCRGFWWQVIMVVVVVRRVVGDA